mgnify:CR=1 FL=1|jgi:glycosyltransferase involved in cell wall biosynthesis
MKKRFLLLGPIVPYKGGISHFNTLLYKSFKKDDDAFFISWKKRFPKFLYPGKDQISKKNITSIKKDKRFILNFVNPLTWFYAFFEIKKKKADYLVLHWVTPALAPIFLTILSLTKIFTRTKIILICHNVLPHEKRVIDKLLTKPIFALADFFIIHSRKDEYDLKMLKKNAKFKLSFHPTYESFKEIKDDSRDLNKELNLRKKVILFFGFVRDYKGLKYLIEAMPKIIKKIDCDLLVVGEFWGSKEPYTSLIEKLGITDRVKIVDDYVPDNEVGNYFDLADVIVLPYVSATQSGIIQVAFGFEKPVITTNVGGLPDVVDDGKTGQLVPPKDADSLADAVIDFYTQSKAEFFLENIKKEKDKFSWERYVNLIKELVN